MCQNMHRAIKVIRHFFMVIQIPVNTMHCLSKADKIKIHIFIVLYACLRKFDIENCLVRKQIKRMSNCNNMALE